MKYSPEFTSLKRRSSLRLCCVSSSGVNTIFQYWKPIFDMINEENIWLIVTVAHLLYFEHWPPPQLKRRWEILVLLHYVGSSNSDLPPQKKEQDLMQIPTGLTWSDLTILHAHFIYSKGLQSPPLLILLGHTQGSFICWLVGGRSGQLRSVDILSLNLFQA